MFGSFQVPPLVAPKSCFLQGESDNRIQFGAANSYSDGIVLSKATGKENYLMNIWLKFLTYATLE